jgi:hypothetical protein
MDSRGTERALPIVAADEGLNVADGTVVLKGEIVSCTVLLAPDADVVETFFGCGPIKEPSRGDVNGEVTCCMIPAVLGFDFVTFFVPSTCAADNVRFRIAAMSLGPTAELNVATMPALSAVSEDKRE